MATSPASSFNLRTRHLERHIGVQVRRATARKAPPGALAQRRYDQSIAPPALNADWTVVQHVIGGNPDWQTSIFSSHTDRLYRAAFAILRNKEDAEDAVQDGLCKAFTNLTSFEGRSSFSTWLTSIVRNEALMARRKKKSHPEASLDEPEGQLKMPTDTGIDRRPDPEQICAAGELSMLMEKGLRRLSSRLRTALWLQMTTDLPAVHLSRSLGITAACFKARVSRARRKLQSTLNLDSFRDRQ